MFDDPGSQLNELIVSISPLFVVAFRRSVASAVELLIARDDLISKIDGIDLDEGTQLSQVLIDNKNKLSEIIRGMGVGRQRQVYDAIKETLSRDMVI